MTSRVAGRSASRRASVDVRPRSFRTEDIALSCEVVSLARAFRFVGNQKKSARSELYCFRRKREVHAILKLLKDRSSRRLRRARMPSALRSRPEPRARLLRRLRDPVMMRLSDKRNFFVLCSARRCDQLFLLSIVLGRNLHLLVPRDGYKARSLTKAVDVASRIRWAACASGLSVPAEKELKHLPRVPRDPKVRSNPPM